MPCKFKQTDITRAVAAAKKAGLEPSGVEIAPDGTLRLLFGGRPPAATSALDAWKEKRSARGAAR